jgi:phage shock protein PspC (stress-responsive transcriptional regulator)
MKKAVKINLSGQIFHIDEDAYEKLKVYLDTISSHFSNANESKEILSDIETRIAELFHEKMNDENQVISIIEVDEVINIMGRPEEIADEEEPSGSQKHREQRASRRLYRDPDNAVLGGVSSGLSAYFNLDVILIRVLFVVLTLIGVGTPILLYIILWIAVPRAQTSAEKLEMRGEKVTVSNIEKTVKEEYEYAKESLKKARNSEFFQNIENGSGSFLKALGTLIRVFLKIILGTIAFFFILAGIGLLFGTFSFLFFGAHFLPFGPDGTIHHTLPELIQPFANPENASALIIAVMILILIPILAVVYGLFKALFRFKAKDKVLGLGGFTIWILALVAVFMIVYYEGRNYQEGKTVSNTKVLAPFVGDTLFVSLDAADLNKMEEKNYLNIDHKWYFSDEMDTFFGDIDINVRKSDNSEFKVKIEKSARGSDKNAAEQLAQGIIYEFQQKDAYLTFDPYYLIEKDGSWRAQSVEVTLYMPVGKAVKFDRNTEDFLGWIQNNDDLSDWEVAGKTMIMKEDGLSLHK